MINQAARKFGFANTTLGKEVQSQIELEVDNLIKEDHTQYAKSHDIHQKRVDMVLKFRRDVFTTDSSCHYYRKWVRPNNMPGYIRMPGSKRLYGIPFYINQKADSKDFPMFFIGTRQVCLENLKRYIERTTSPNLINRPPAEMLIDPGMTEDVYL